MPVDGFTIFTETVWDYYARHGRNLPWRQPMPDGSFDPYAILVSEIMLQQTQVSRVIPKFADFLKQFPTVESLAAAHLSQVLACWNGLGYNRRAKFLHQAAQALSKLADGFPASQAELMALPGVGSNTAAAILNYAFNQPIPFVETNIRTVYIHHFFADEAQVDDKQILDLVAQTIDTAEPRQWFWALMDYGSFLKQTVGNLARASRSYTKQSTFRGSRRQLRGQVLRALLDGPKTVGQLQQSSPDTRLPAVLTELCTERLISQQANHYQLGS